MSTFISCIDECDNFRVKNDPTLVPFYLSSSPAAERQLIGILKPQIIDLLQAHDAQRVASSSAAAFDILLGAGKDSVAFSASIDTPEKRSAVMRDLGHHWRDQGLFAEVLGGRLWRNELYAVRASPFRGWTPDAPPAFMMERVVCALFGIVTYGVHLSCYTADYRVWVPRRAKTKQTSVVSCSRIGNSREQLAGVSGQHGRGRHPGGHDPVREHTQGSNGRGESF